MELTVNNGILDFFTSLMGSKYLILFFLSMLPVTELRLSIPIGVLLFKLPWLYVFAVCVVSNIFIGALLVFSLSYVVPLFEKISFFKRLLSRFMDISKNRYGKYERFKSKGLILFVGIPLPGTGVWTGSMVSYVLALSRPMTIASIAQGVIISGTIMTVLSVSGKVII